MLLPMHKDELRSCKNVVGDGKVAEKSIHFFSKYQKMYIPLYRVKEMYGYKV